MEYLESDNVAANDGSADLAAALPSHGYGSDAGSVPRSVPSNTSNPAVPGKLRQLSEEEWEDLKDYFHTLYIKQNKTLGKIRKSMRQEHNILLTDNQLTKRFAKWKFKKNVKQAETKAFLQKGEPSSTGDQYQFEGVRVTAAKRERWGKRARLDPQQGLQSSFESQQTKFKGDKEWVEGLDSPKYVEDHAGVEVVENTNVYRSYSQPHLEPAIASNAIDHDASNKTLSHSPSTLSPNTLTPHATNSNVSSSAKGGDSPSADPSPAMTTSVAFDESNNSPSDDALIPGSELQLSSASMDTESVLLGRLFSALSFQSMADIAPFRHSRCATPSENGFEDSETISGEDFKNLSRGSEDAPWRSTQMTIGPVSGSFSRKRKSTSAFKHLGIDLMFPSETVAFAVPSLSGELYPFPRRDDGPIAAISTLNYHDTLKMEVQECSEKISKLELLSPENRSAVNILMDRLAVAYFGLGKYDEAEQQFSRLLPKLVKHHGSESQYVISVKRDLAEVILHLGRYQEANEMAQEVLSSTLVIDVHGGYLTQRSIQVLAQSYGNLRNLEKEEELLRELVQIRLALLGPRHGDTLAAIRSLTDSTIDAERHSESEELLRVALELSQSAHGMSDRRKCLIFRKLATVLYKQGKYQESEACYRKTADMCECFLGNEHPDTLRCRFWLCRVLRSQGRLDESKELLEKTIEQQIRTRGELRGSTIESMVGLSTLLLQMNMMAETKMWMERVLRCSLQNGGLAITRVTKFWSDLEKLEREKADGISDLYSEMSSEICTQVGPGSRSIEEMTKWSDRHRR